MTPPPSQLQPTLAPDTAASELQPVPSPGATAGTLQFRPARGVAAGELQPVPTPAKTPDPAPPSLAFPPGPAEQLAETAASHGLTVMPLQGTGPTQTLQVVDAGRAVLLYSAAAGATAGGLRVQDADVPAYLTAYRAHPHLPPPALLDLLQHEGTALPSLNAARELARNHDLEVRIVRAAGTAYITLCEPAAPAPPVLSYTPGAASAFHGPCEIPAGAVPGYLAAYRHSVDQGVFTREHRAADWPRRVAQLTPHVVEGSGHHIPEVARNLQAAALAQAGETRFLDRAELAAPPLTLTAERQAQITEAITDNAAGYHRAGGDPARYIAEGHIDGSDREQDWIRTYIKAHPQVIQADPVPLSAQQQRHAAAAAAQTAEADRISRVAYAAFTSGQPDEALSLLDEAELADPIRGDLWERRRAHVRQAGHTPAQQPGVAGRGPGRPAPELEAGQ
jgi:hypothetical protein